MCGRFTLTTPPEEIARRFELEETPALRPRYNVAPGQDVAVVRAATEPGGRVLDRLRWGLVPAWAKDPAVGARMINARAETAPEKPAFRDAFRRRRCLVPADGFYEWRRASRQPFRIHRPDDALFAIAGLWERWRSETGDLLESCTLLTTAPNAEVRELHDRMPAILGPEHWRDWLDPAQGDAARLQALLAPRPDGELVLHPVDRRVNHPDHDDPACVAPVAREPDPPQQLGFDLGPGSDA